MTAQQISTTRYLTNTFQWQADPTTLFADKETFVMDTILNDSDDSKYGPGVWLDIDSITVRTNLPTLYPHRLGGFGAEQHFAYGELHPNGLKPNIYYFIALRSNPTDAAKDNANLQAVLSQQYCPLLLCILERTTCTINPGFFDIDPVPGNYFWNQPPADHCRSFFPTWLTYIVR